MFRNCLVRTFVAADRDLFAADGHFHATVFYFPFAYGTFRCIHCFSSELIYEPWPMIRGYCARGFSGYQILAHFADVVHLQFAANLGRRFAEFAPENIGEMAVTGEAEVEGDAGNIGIRGGDSFERRPKPEKREISMNGQAGLLLKDTREIER